MLQITASIFKQTFQIFSFLLILQLLIIGLETEKAFSQDSASFSQTVKDHTTLGVNIRLRDEYWNTFEKRGTDTDDSYNFFLIRARAFIDFKWEKFRVHVLMQGVKAFDFPKNGAFGPGPLYYNAIY